jgi:hypothetical protein
MCIKIWSVMLMYTMQNENANHLTHTIKAKEYDG